TLVKGQKTPNSTYHVLHTEEVNDQPKRRSPVQQEKQSQSQ
ncbi:hypothetical protein M91_16471, partial [Bos mutus]